MTDNPTELCEKLRLYGWRFYGSRTLFDAADLIEAQVARIQQQTLEYMSLFDQCSEAVARVAELEEGGRYVDNLCMRPYPNPEWIVEALNMNGITMDRSAVIRTSEYIGRKANEDVEKNYSMRGNEAAGSGVMYVGYPARLKERIAELEAKCSMLEKAREQDPICVKWYADRFDKDQDRIDELQAQLERSNRLLAEVAALKRYDANAKKGYTAGLWITLSVPGNLLERIDAAISANKGEQE